jgi:hypothetical protein
MRPAWRSAALVLLTSALNMSHGALDLRSVEVGRQVLKQVRSKRPHGAAEAHAHRPPGLKATCGVDPGHAVRQAYGVLPHSHVQTGRIGGGRAVPSSTVRAQSAREPLELTRANTQRIRCGARGSRAGARGREGMHA